jgi:hypothetical protein
MADDGYIVEVERHGPWRWRATIFVILHDGDASAPAPLVTLRAVSAAGARRRAARFIELRQRLAGEASTG